MVTAITFTIRATAGRPWSIPTPERLRSDREQRDPEAAIKGVVEDLTGKAKEIIGIVVNHEDLRKEGRAQQEKAQAQRDVAQKEAAGDHRACRGEGGRGSPEVGALERN